MKELRVIEATRLGVILDVEFYEVWITDDEDKDYQDSTMLAIDKQAKRIFIVGKDRYRFNFESLIEDKVLDDLTGFEHFEMRDAYLWNYYKGNKEG